MIRSKTPPHLCACCGAQSRGIGYAPRADQPVLWLCSSLDCIEIASEVYKMKLSEMNRIEREAAIDGGGAALGTYLDSIGKTDLAQLDTIEFAEVCKRMVSGYSEKLKELLSSNVAPF